MKQQKKSITEETMQDKWYNGAKKKPSHILQNACMQQQKLCSTYIICKMTQWWYAQKV